MKLRGALLLVVAATVCALSGLFSPQEAAASIDAVNQWPAKPTIVSNSNTAAVSGSFTVAPGTKRLMLVAVAFESANAPTVAVSYGGQALTQIVLNTTGANKLWLGRLNDAGIVAAGADKTLSATLTGAGTITATYVTAAVYAGVDQSTPVIGSSSLGTTATALTIGPVGYTPSVAPINGNNGLSVYLVNWNNTNVGQTTPATGFTEVRDYIGTNFSLSANYKVKTGASAESITSTTTTPAIAALAAVTLNPAAGAGALSVATVTTCSDCHGYPPQDGPYVTARNTPPGQFPGAHSKHSGTDEGQYGYACTECHYNNGTNLRHENAFKNISGSRVPRNTYGGATNIPMTDTSLTETCTKSTCHSNGRATRQYAPSPAWNGTTTCLSCHGGRNGTNAYAKSASNFALSTTHQQHLGKYDYTLMNCQTCHGKTAANHTALKDYSGAIYHGNGAKTVLFTNIAYGSYTSYKAGTKKCSNTACHGGSSRSAWTDSGTINTNNTCVHCHGVAVTSAALANSGANRRFFAPGYKVGATVGTSTDQLTSSNDIRVGAHFKHLSSVYMRAVDCNECHSVPDSPFSGTHMVGTRYNSQTLTFAQSSSARISIGVAAPGTPTLLASFGGYTSGTSIKAATCSSTYCHGSRLKTGDTSGSYTRPYWNYSAMINYTNPNQACGRCHGNPPTTGSSQTTHSAYVAQPTTSCSTCHNMVVNSSGQIINRNLHINGQVNSSGGHEYGFGGKKHRPGGTGSIVANAAAPYSNCNGCHTVSPGGSYPVTRYVAANIICTSCHINVANFTGATPGCWDCHGSSAANGQPNGAANAFPNWSGSHSAHSAAPYSLVCADCHFNAGSGSVAHGNYSGIVSTRANVNVVFNTSKAGTAATWTAGTLSCSTSLCHGQKSPAWGAVIPNQQCRYCHGSQSVSYTNLSAAQVAPGTGNIDTNRTTGITVRGGMHQEHLTGTSSISRKAKCGECHTPVTAVNQASHLNYTTASVNFSGVATMNADIPLPTVARVTGIVNCNNVECHMGQRPEGTAANQSGFASRAALAWNNSALLGGTTVTDTCLNKCHGLPPGGGLAGDSHSGLLSSGSYTTPASLASCSSQSPATGCHPTINAAPTSMANIFFDRNLHINGTVEGGSCLGCHAGEIGTAPYKRAGVAGQFASQSHHIQGGESLTNDKCYQCHMEANNDGTINATYHLKTTKASVDLVVWAAGSRGTSYISYTANGSRNQISKLNDHCLSCHNSVNAAQTPFGTFRTDQYSPEARLATPKAKTSILSRYSSTRTVAWSQYRYSTATGGVNRFGTNNKYMITKALSAHGNASKNQMMDWDTISGEDRSVGITPAAKDNTYSGTSKDRNVFCYDCHNSHGSDASGVTSSYSSATGRNKGGLLKSTVANVGGYTVTYKPASRTIQYRNYSAYTKTTATVNAGASICNDCHNTDTRKVNIAKPWSVTGTYSSTKAIVGYWSTPYFDNYTAYPAQRSVYKRGAAAGMKNMTLPMGGHFGTSVANTSAAHTGDINGLCTPCHDPHGVSNALNADRDHGVPLLKGTWVTSPYREDKADTIVKRGGGSNWTGMNSMGAVPGYHIDQNTFLPAGTATGLKSGGAATATAKSNLRSQRFRSFSNLSSAKTGTGYPNLTVASFGGLCMECHTQTALTGSASAPAAASGWLSKERVHQSVSGWAATASGTDNLNNRRHAYTCAKCHAPHVSRLPRLLVTNCLDARHSGKVGAVGQANNGMISTATATTNTFGNINQSLASSAYGAGRFPGGGSRYSNTPASAQNPGGWWFTTNGAAGTTQANSTTQTPPATTYGSNCHNSATAGGATWSPANQIWNKKSRW